MCFEGIDENMVEINDKILVTESGSRRTEYQKNAVLIQFTPN